MILPLKNIRLSLVDTGDETFRVSDPAGASLLAESIRAVGLLNPVVLQENGKGGYRIVSGFRRIAALRSLGWDEIPSRVATAEADFDGLAFLAVSENAASRPLSIMEESRAVALLGPGRPWEERTKLAEKALRLAANPRHLERLESLSRLPAFIREAISSEAVAFAMALTLGRLPEDDARVLAELFSILKLSLSKQRELLDISTDISKRDEVALREVLAGPAIAAILEESGGDRGLAARRVREHLKRRRFPHLSAAEENFSRNAAELRLPQGAAWEPPPFFEGEQHTLSIRVKSRAELAARKDLVASLLENPALSRILP